VIFDSSAWDQLDVTSTEVVRSLVKELRGNGIAMYFADVHAPVLEDCRRTGLLDFIGEDHVYPTVDTAVRSLEAE